MKKHGLMLLAAMLASASVWAHEGHEQAVGEGSQAMAMPQTMPGAFLQKKEIDGYEVSFHVMKAKEGHAMGGAYDLMIKVEKDGKPAPVAAANSKVISPTGKPVSKMMMRMGDWFMAGYDLGQSGQYQLMVLFKSEDGQKHFGGVYYPAAAPSGSEHGSHH
ncbi:hypothetical protein FEF65_08715 [Mariprofundus erugo]|uniref:YtkA-like domain-containing protein n=1 Tax=Mariprofundus erugo TaxID=2528639 RepID=A0A5R9GKD4_9PROT|nr:hypothetical protein [Mariprofundus erugo]TLS67021.1 hypothetical protein FEF65_08715 [Mariprofundus erugo]